MTGLLAFFLPIYPKILPILIGLLFINWIIVPSNIKHSITSTTRSYTVLALIVLYLLYVLGMIYTSNLSSGWKVLETKLSILILPLIYLAYIDLTKERINHYLRYFVYGSLTYVVICLGYATYAYLKPVYIDLYGSPYNMGLNYFYYSYLSLFFHPSYAALYSVFALSIIFIGIYKKEAFINWRTVCSIILLILFILLLSSKAGWVCLILLFFSVFIKLIYSKRFFRIFYFLVPTAIFFVLFNVYFTPKFSNRLPQVEVIWNALIGRDQENNKVKTSKDGNASRVLIWRASLEVFGDHPFLGVGTGDAKEELLERYKTKGMTTEYEQKLNCHNQFLSTSIAVGLPGLLSLLFLSLFPFVGLLRNRLYIVGGFALFVTINFLFESFLERQAGVIFYAFFNSLLGIAFMTKENK